MDSPQVTGGNQYGNILGDNITILEFVTYLRFSIQLFYSLATWWNVSKLEISNDSVGGSQRSHTGDETQ